MIQESLKFGCNDQLVFSRLEEGGFIEIKNIKKRIRDLIDPSRGLGHNDPGTE